MVHRQNVWIHSDESDNHQKWHHRILFEELKDLRCVCMLVRVVHIAQPPLLEEGKPTETDRIFGPRGTFADPLADAIHFERE
eukprot:5450451-Amphidinium_carterae.1